jgi:hypothetical protein
VDEKSQVTQERLYSEETKRKSTGNHERGGTKTDLETSETE